MLLIDKKNKELGLTFDKEEHKFTIGGKPTRFSVTQIANESDFDYSKLPDIEYRLKLGTIMHELAEDVANVALGKIPDFEEREELYADTKKELERILNEFKILAAEQPICSPKKMLPGVADIIAEKDEENYLIDFKTSKHVYSSHRWQLNIYAAFLKYVYDFPIDKIMVIKIDRETGDIQTHKIKIKPISVVSEFVDMRMEKLKEREWNLTQTY